MASQRKSIKGTHTYRAGEPYADKVKQAGEMADELLQRYGAPAISLSELRAKLDGELRGIAITDVIMKEREAGW